METEFIYGRVLVGESLIGYIQYNPNFKLAYPVIRQTLKELQENAGRGNREYPKNSRKIIKRSPKQEVGIYIETGWTSDSKTPPIQWKSEICLETLTITGNRMPYSPRAIPSKILQENGKPNVEAQYIENLKSLYTLPSH